jgi:hypothetical protein
MARPIEIANPIPGGSKFTKNYHKLVEKGYARVTEDGKLLIIKHDADYVKPVSVFTEDEKATAKHPLQELKIGIQSRGVYILRASSGLYKIGKTVNVVKRLINLWSMIPEEVYLFAFLPCHGHTAKEWILHREFDSRRVKGEWFKLLDEDIAKILDEHSFLLINENIKDFIAKYSS